ncbi:facilitated trehalose transporter Tret1-like [Agrilus planipennis]|uniref:Facilitated trehalose transporter Tret1-like n=1 Tax=Agrilus planipennis TaxID=224129 RepID=A0A7F5RBG4_AGRPL|nr:facilitated trehalose transporter Tret1-like [Agrilus planipennis]XP_025833316.1 facilitated trehalose transporter Tret1-like [Agrilus planipennis]XP_025833317.1 facilitated trehalose transporter Tret1-like [Agrilus planipennis]XP_025833318.1 facilitated trehalose transporter Tret1-like [Agrilus planipennis]
MLQEAISKWRYRQYLYCIAALLSFTASEIHGTWSSPFIPELESENSPIGVQLATMESALVVSLYNLGLFVGSVITLPAYDIFGRKIMFAVANGLNLISWVFIFFARAPITLYIGRIIAGMGAVICMHVSPMYLGEISDNDNRGKLGFFYSISSSCGSVIGLIIGPYVSYRTFAIMAFCVVLIAIACLLLIPETPYFLIKKHKHEEAEKVIWKLASNSSDKEFVKKRLEEITESVQKDMLNKTSIKELLCSGKYTRPLLLHVGLNFLFFMSGIAIVRSYLQTILNTIESPISSNLSSLIFGVASIISVLISGQVVDRLGRKPLLLTSCIVSAISMCSLGAYFYINDTKSFDMHAVTWLPLAILIVYQIFIAIGINSVPQVIVSELYPMNVKGIAIGTIGTLLNPLSVIAQMTYEPLNDWLGLYGSFWMYSACCIFGIFFTIFCLPETRGKSFQQIQMEINKKWVETDDAK